MTMEQIVNRAIEFTGTYGNVRTTPERVDDLARAKLCALAAQQQLVAFAHWCYKRDDNRRLLNVLPHGQIASGSWTPWGASGKSGMTRLDRDTLRLWMLTERMQRRFPPWFYDSAERRWYVDFIRHETIADALDWLKKHPIQPKIWLELRGSIRQ